MNKMLLSAALAGVLAAGITATAAQADDGTKCYGIAKAGQNACKAANGSHECKGHATKDNDPNDFVLSANKAACETAKGSVDAPKK